MVEISLEDQTNLPRSFWTRHLNPLPSCFLLKCEQQVLFFQQHIPEIEQERYRHRYRTFYIYGYRQLINVHTLWSTCVISTVLTRVCVNLHCSLFSVVWQSMVHLKHFQTTVLLKDTSRLCSHSRHKLPEVFYLTSHWSLPSFQEGQRILPALSCWWLCAGLDTVPQSWRDCTKTGQRVETFPWWVQNEFT